LNISIFSLCLENIRDIEKNLIVVQEIFATFGKISTQKKKHADGAECARRRMTNAGAVLSGHETKRG